MRLPAPTNPDHKKRLNEWKNWLANFKALSKKRNSFTYIPNAAWILNDLYWRMAEQYLRPMLKPDADIEEEHKIHHYKIISTSEIVVMMVQPIEIKADERTRKKLNAGLAWFIATQIIEGWNTGSPVKLSASVISSVAEYQEHIEKNERYPESFAVEHINWLSLLNITVEKPIFINAQCWRLFYLSCFAVAAKGKLK